MILLYVLGILLIAFGAFEICGRLFVKHLLAQREPLKPVKTFLSQDRSAKLICFSQLETSVSKIPIILIGGLGGNERCWGKGWLVPLTRDLKDTYEVYVFAFESYKFGCLENAYKLKECLDKAGVQNPVVLTHSSGMWIWRAFKLFYGQDYVYRKLISLAGPYHGVPTLIPKWAAEGFKRVFPILGEFIASHMGDPERPGMKELAWDNYDKAIPAEFLEAVRPNSLINHMNRIDTDWAKYVMVAGKKDLEKARSNIFKYLILMWATIWKARFVEDIFSNIELDYGALILANIPHNPNRDKKLIPFEENEGVVPVASALADQIEASNASQKKIFVGYDHDDLTILGRDPSRKLYNFVLEILHAQLSD